MDDSYFSIDKPEESTGFLLWQLTNFWQREIKKVLEPFKLTHSQFVLLANIQFLFAQGQDVTQVLLSNQTKIDPMTTSTVLRTLQSKGLVKRKEHTIDTRAKRVALTGKGAEILKKAIMKVEEFDKVFFSKLGSRQKGFNKNVLVLLNQ